MNQEDMNQEDIACIMNAINDAISGLGYTAVGYDNTNTFLNVTIEHN